MDTWKQQMQESSSTSTFIVEGGRVMGEDELPDQFRRDASHLV